MNKITTYQQIIMVPAKHIHAAWSIYVPCDCNNPFHLVVDYKCSQDNHPPIWMKVLKSIPICNQSKQWFSFLKDQPVVVLNTYMVQYDLGQLGIKAGLAPLA